MAESQGPNKTLHTHFFLRTDLRRALVIKFLLIIYGHNTAHLALTHLSLVTVSASLGAFNYTYPPNPQPHLLSFKKTEVGGSQIKWVFKIPRPKATVTLGFQ